MRAYTIVTFLAAISLIGCDAVSTGEQDIDSTTLLSNLAVTEPCSPDAIDCGGGGGGGGGGSTTPNRGVCKSGWQGNYKIGSGNEDSGAQYLSIGDINVNNRLWNARVYYSHNAYSSSGRLRANAMTQLRIKCSTSGSDADQWWTPSSSDFPNFKVKATVSYFNDTVLDPGLWSTYWNPLDPRSRFNVINQTNDSDSYNSGFVHTKTTDTGSRLYDSGVIQSEHRWTTNNWYTYSSTFLYGKSFAPSCPSKNQYFVNRNDNIGHETTCRTS